MNRTCIVLWLWSLYVGAAVAQMDTLRVIGPDVVVSAASNSDLAQQTLASTGALHEALSELSSIQIQQLAPGGLATAINGASAARHLALLWEGWSIQSPINGTYDLSLVPMSIFNESNYVDRVQLRGSGTSSHRGVIDLGSTSDDYISYTYDTWNDHRLGISKTINFGSSTLSVATAVTERDLAYRYDRFGTIDRQDAAGQRGGDIQVSYDVALTRAWSLSAGTWWQWSDRELAPSKTAANAREVQTDDNRRTHMSLTYQKGRHRLLTKAAYFDEHIHYRSNVVDSKADNYASMLATTYTYAGRHPTTVEVLIRRDLIRSTFDINTQRSTVQLFVGKDFVINDRIRLSTNIRQDLIDEQWQPTTLSARANYSRELIDIEVQHSYSYTPPTLNDLYWPQLGNPELRTEQGSLTSLQLRSNGVIKYCDISLTAHHQLVDNWILWSPDNSGIWRPSNARDVVANSLTLDLSYLRPLRAVSTLGFSTSLTYGPTTSLDTRSNSRKQLIYTPRLRLTAGVDYTCKGWQGRLSLRHTGRRYTDIANTQSIDPFTLMDASINYTFNNDLSIGLQIFNVWDQRYEIVPFFPTSLRYFSFSIKQPI